MTRTRRQTTLATDGLCDLPPTARQLEIHRFMTDYQREHGAPPTMREIAEQIGASSLNAAASHMRAMERKAMVRHEEGRARGWVPIALPEEIQ